MRALLECYAWQSIRIYLPNHSIAMAAQELKACAMACAFLGNTLEPLWSWESISWHVYCMEICMQGINGVGPHILIAYDCITKHISIRYGSSWKLMVSLKWIGQAPVIGKTFNVCLQHFPLVDEHNKTYHSEIKISMISWLYILIFSGKDLCSLWNDCESFCAIIRRLQTGTKRKTHLGMMRNIANHPSSLWLQGSLSNSPRARGQSAACCNLEIQTVVENDEQDILSFCHDSQRIDWYSTRF